MNQLQQMKQPSAALDDQLAKRSNNLEKLVVKRQLELALLDKTIVDRQEILGEQKQKYVTWQQKLQAAKIELQHIKLSIFERTEYADKQEQLIARQAEEGNLQLRGLEYEILEAKQVIKDLEIRKKNLFEDTGMLEKDMETARQDFALEIAEHEASMHSLHADL